mmetsp:Transcript_55141/g.107851  ORF Transcript_55141/g.107851 Transcript_55141/m.107851 type:complete len:81 (-) Transcript_55141:504-746(-)
MRNWLPREGDCAKKATAAPRKLQQRQRTEGRKNEVSSKKTKRRKKEQKKESAQEKGQCQQPMEVPSIPTPRHPFRIEMIN